MSGPTIPAESRPSMCQLALDAQKACLDSFDAIEAGDLVTALMAVNRLMDAAGELTTAVRVHAAIELARIERATGVKFGANR